MQSEEPLPVNQDGPAQGLPPVAPPSGKMLAQFFLVPLLIISVVLLIVGGIYWLVGGKATPEQFLKKLDDTNPDVRWRAAHDLATDLSTDDRLAADPKFALDVADRLRLALDDNQAAERSEAEKKGKHFQSPGSHPPKALEAERNFIIYLSRCLGQFMVPVGEPLLAQIAATEDGADAKTMTLRRRQAVWALANLGENLQRFDKLSAERQEAIMAELDQQAAAHQGERSQWARTALAYWKGRKAGQPTALGLDQVLAGCAKDRYPMLRQIAALALTYWKGDPAENARMEQTLLALLRDDGHGTSDEIRLLNRGENEPYDATDDPRMQGLEIRYQAALALARRGSAKAPLAVLHDMLSEETEKQSFHTKLKDGRDVPDLALAYQTLLSTLKAVVALHRQQPGLDLAELYAAIKELTQSPNVAVRAEADKTLIALGQTK